jgi:hypothetical protein
MIRRVFGTLLILLGVLGIALCALGVVYVWRAAEDVAAAADDTLLTVSETLDDIDRSLRLASTTLDDTGIAIAGLYNTSLDVSDTLSSTQVTIDEMARLTEDDLPQSIEASLLALDGLEDSAGVIDRLLRSLQQFGIGDYNPPVPLNEAVAAAQSGLAMVPSSLRTMGDGLRDTSTNLDEVEQGVVVMSRNVMLLEQNVNDADAAVSEHRSNLRELRTRVIKARRNVEQPIQAAAWGATLLLIWIALSQLAIIQWGVTLWQRRPPR